MVHQETPGDNGEGNRHGDNEGQVGGANPGEGEESDGARNLLKIPAALVALMEFVECLVKILPIDVNLLKSEELWEVFEVGFIPLFEEYCSTNAAPERLITDSLRFINTCLHSAASNSLLENIYDVHRQVLEDVARLSKKIHKNAARRKSGLSNDLADAAKAS